MKTEEERQMQRRYNLAHSFLASVVVLVLAPLMIAVETQAQIVFASDRVWDDWEWEIYVIGYRRR